MTATTEKTKKEAAKNPAEVPVKTVPFVSTTLHTLWIAESWPTYGFVWSSTGPPPTGRDMPHYLVTPNVYAWLRQQLGVFEDKVMGDPNGGADMRKLLAETAQKWFPIADWAEAEYTPEQRQSAVAELPKVTVKFSELPS